MLAAARSPNATCVNAGSSAPAEGNVLASATHRLTTSCARPSGRTAELDGSVPMRTVPQPDSPCRRAAAAGCIDSGACTHAQPTAVSVWRICADSFRSAVPLVGRQCTVSSPPRPTSTRLAESGRPSAASRKSSECAARAPCGPGYGEPASATCLCVLPMSRTCPAGYRQPGDAR